MMLIRARYSVRGMAVWVLICMMAGWTGSMFTRPAIESWYNNLCMPWFTPPSWVFAPVWTALYLAMGLAAGMIWSTARGEGRRVALRLFALQLVLNVLWSPAFFGLRSPLAGMIVILPLLTAAVLCTRAFIHVDRVAGALMIPYILWLFYASVLNGAILAIN